MQSNIEGREDRSLLTSISLASLFLFFTTDFLQSLLVYFGLYDGNIGLFLSLANYLFLLLSFFCCLFMGIRSFLRKFDEDNPIYLALLNALFVLFSAFPASSRWTVFFFAEVMDSPIMLWTWRLSLFTSLLFVILQLSHQVFFIDQNQRG